jgi:hypothetical protein
LARDPGHDVKRRSDSERDDQLYRFVRISALRGGSHRNASGEQRQCQHGTSSHGRLRAPVKTGEML